MTFEGFRVFTLALVPGLQAVNTVPTTCQVTLAHDGEITIAWRCTHGLQGYCVPNIEAKAVLEHLWLLRIS